MLFKCLVAFFCASALSPPYTPGPPQRVSFTMFQTCHAFLVILDTPIRKVVFYFQVLALNPCLIIVKHELVVSEYHFNLSVAKVLSRLDVLPMFDMIRNNNEVFLHKNIVDLELHNLNKCINFKNNGLTDLLEFLMMVHECMHAWKLLEEIILEQYYIDSVYYDGMSLVSEYCCNGFVPLVLKLASANTSLH